MKINIGIVGYGNLGKAVEQVILSKYNLNLVAIFSRRLVQSKFNTLIDNYDNITNYINKIDIMLLCGGSFGDMQTQSREILKNFDCINTFDNHNQILQELKSLDIIAKSTNHRLVMSCGWDPGIFSNIRALCYALSNVPPSVFWGKGISMGHSEAIRKVNHVFDAVQFTIPNKKTKTLARNGNEICNENMHFRECFVVADKKYHKKIKKDICNIPNYFKGQNTKVNFVSQTQLLYLKSKMSHKGEIISNFKTIHGSKNFIDFKISMNSNPNFTATIMCCYINTIINLKNKNISGTFSPLDIPMIDLFNSDERLKIIEKLC